VGNLVVVLGNGLSVAANERLGLENLTRPLQLIARDRRRMHTNENLTLARHGTVGLLQPEAIGM
jgi:hypothetical protein